MKTGRRRNGVRAAAWAYMRSVLVPIRLGNPRSEGSQWDSTVHWGSKRTLHSTEAIFISYCKLCKGWAGSTHIGLNCSDEFYKADFSSLLLSVCATVCEIQMSTSASLSSIRIIYSKREVDGVRSGVGGGCFFFFLAYILQWSTKLSTPDSCASTRLCLCIF